MKRAYLIPLIIALVVGPIAGYIVYNGLVNKSNQPEEQIDVPKITCIEQLGLTGPYWEITLNIGNIGVVEVELEKIFFNNVEITSNKNPPDYKEISTTFPNGGLNMSPKTSTSVKIYIDQRYGDLKHFQKVQVKFMTAKKMEITVNVTLI